MSENKPWYRDLKPITPAAEKMKTGEMGDKEKKFVAFLEAMRNELETTSFDAEKQSEYLRNINAERQSRGAGLLESATDFDNAPEYDGIKASY